MKMVNNKGFVISTLIYGIMILFVFIMNILIISLIFRYNLLLDLNIKMNYYEYDEQINIHLYNDNLYESEYVVPYNATYYLYEVSEDQDDVSGEPFSIYLEKGEVIKLINNNLVKNGNNIHTIQVGNKLIIGKIISTTKLNIPNPPDLSPGLIPIKYVEDDKKWVIVRDTSQWYDYDNQIWANAVILKNKSKDIGDDVQVDIDKTTNKIEDELDVYAMFVWIPRFSYTIGCTSTDSCLGYKINGASDLDKATPGAIDIKFVSTEVTEDPGVELIESPVYPTYIYKNEKSRNPSNWYTHPAFAFGNDKLSGIWVGKFETSVNIKSTCYDNLKNKNIEAETNCNSIEEDVTPRILPNVLSLVYQNVYNQYETAKKFKNNATLYNLTSNIDSHMMKNSEWGAVAYLSQSIYGKYGNNSYEGAKKEIYKNDSGTNTSVEGFNGTYFSWYTGRSEGTSPTTDSYSEEGQFKYDDIKVSDGTIVSYSGTGASTTGNIYGIYDMSGGALEYVMGSYNNTIKDSNFDFSWFDELNNIKYYDKFTFDNTKISKETIGHATAETSNWYSDSLSSVNDNNPWLTRGGFFISNQYFNSGIFYSSMGDGSNGVGNSFRSVLVSKND